MYECQSKATNFKIQNKVKVKPIALRIKLFIILYVSFITLHILRTLSFFPLSPADFPYTYIKCYFSPNLLIIFKNKSIFKQYFGIKLE